MKNSYTMGENLKNCISKIYTFLFFKGARLIRRPFYIRGKRFFQYGTGLTTGYSCRFEIFGEKNETAKKLIIGSNCKMGDNVHISAGKKIEIGDNVLMASKIFISDISHGDYSVGSKNSPPTIPPNDRPLCFDEINIGNNVWLGDNVCVLQGVKIGNGCIIGANSVVTKSISDNCIAAGIPAKVIKQYNFDSGIWEPVREEI